jgi:hypothetical protein
MKIGNLYPDFTIDKSVEYDGDVIIMISLKSNKCINENVVRLSVSDDIIWIIEKSEHVYNDSPYVNIYLEDNYLYAFNWDASMYKIDLQTGRIIDKQFMK